jgi:protein-L-isoaspartate O-methyltransferase
MSQKLPDVLEEGPPRAARVLREAEDRLRAEGMTGARAFQAVLDAVRERLGDAVEVHPVARAAVSELPTGGGVDLLGLAYERIFADLFKGRRGQYFTPQVLVDLLLDRLDLRPGEEVLDPTCGSGAFLVSAARRGARVWGIERDPLLAGLAGVNLRLAGVEGTVRCGDFFATEPDPKDVVVANPPFSVEIRDPDVLVRYDLAAGRDRVLSDWLFVEAVERWVRPGGRAGVVLPWSLLANASSSPLRGRIDAAWVREAVCALPEGVFRPFGGAAGRACLLWLRRRPCPDTPTDWAVLDDPGYDVRSTHLRPTSSAEVQRLRRVEGWTTLPADRWTPAPGDLQVSARSLAELVRARVDRVVPSRDPEGEVGLVDLADADKGTGEAAVRRVRGEAVRGDKAALGDGDLLVSRLRPALGNVAMVYRPPGLEGPLVGSTEWIPLTAERWPHYLLHALRTPAWRARLPVTGGQTRPRTSPGAVLASSVPWPGEEAAARIHALSERAHRRRAALRDQLSALQALVDRFAEGELDEGELLAALEDLERDGLPG